MIATTKNGTTYEFTEDRLKVRKEGRDWEDLYQPVQVELGFRMVMLIRTTKSASGVAVRTTSSVVEVRP